MMSGVSADAQNAQVLRNLRELVGRSASVAEFCRVVAINRQQFNKYLAGTHTPSRASLMKIAAKCGLAMQDFSLAPEAFVRHLDDRSASPGNHKLSGHLQTLESFARASAHALKPFLGSYFRYHHSSIFSGRVVRALTVIYDAGGVIEYVTIERLPVQDGKTREVYTFSYRGICYLMGNRVFMSDYERKQCNEMTSTTLMPQFRTPIRYMLGLLMGIAATAYGQPFAARVAFERISDDLTVRKHLLRQATLLMPDDAEIPVSVRDYIGAASGALLLAAT